MQFGGDYTFMFQSRVKASVYLGTFRKMTSSRPISMCVLHMELLLLQTAMASSDYEFHKGRVVSPFPFCIFGAEKRAWRVVCALGIFAARWPVSQGSSFGFELPSISTTPSKLPRPLHPWVKVSGIILPALKQHSYLLPMTWWPLFGALEAPPRITTSHSSIRTKWPLFSVFSQTPPTSKSKAVWGARLCAQPKRSPLQSWALPQNRSWPLSAFLPQDGPPALLHKTLIFFFFLRISVRSKCNYVCKSPTDLWHLPNGELSVINGLFIFIMSCTLKYNYKL